MFLFFFTYIYIYIYVDICKYLHDGAYDNHRKTSAMYPGSFGRQVPAELLVAAEVQLARLNQLHEERAASKGRGESEE